MDREIIRGSRKALLSRSKHQLNGSGNHAKWLSQPIEEATFDSADYGNFTKSNGDVSWISDGNLWGFQLISNSIQTVGTKHQQFGFFPATRNPTDHWHGYPIIPFSEKNKKYNISKELLERWVLDGYLSNEDIAIIIKGKIL